jgi:hypothetical protein
MGLPLGKGSMKTTLFDEHEIIQLMMEHIRKTDTLSHVLGN